MEDGSNTMKGGSQKVMGHKRKREREREKNEVYHTNCYLGKMASTFVFPEFQLKHENLITS